MKLHFVYIGIPIELGNLLVLKEVRTRPEANKAIEEIVKDLDDLYADFKEKCAQNLSNNTGNNTHVQLGFYLEYIATRLNEHSLSFDGLPVITSTSESVAKQVSSATEFAMSATATPAHSYNNGKGRKEGKGKGNGRQNDGGNENNQRGTGRDPDNSRSGANSAIVARKITLPFLRAFGTTGRQEPSEVDAALQMMIRNTMTLWLVLYNIELENQGFKVDNFYVFISLVSTKEERRAAFRKAKNNLKAKADAGDTGWEFPKSDAKTSDIGNLAFLACIYKRRATGEIAVSSAHRESAKSALFL